MKKIFLAVMALFTLAGLSAQDNRYDGYITFYNGSLKEIRDSICFSIDIQINSRAIDSKMGIRFVPVIVAGSHSLELPDLLIMGQNKSASYERSKKILSKRERIDFREPYQTLILEDDKSASFHYTYSAPYELWMDEGRLVIFQEMINPRDERTLVAMSFDNKVQLSPREPYIPHPKANMVMPPVEKKIRNRQGQAYLDFQSGKSVIIPTFRRNPQELGKIKDAVYQITTNPDVVVNSLFIEGYASPEGRYETNERLAHDRAYALKNYIIQNFGLPLSESQIRVSWVAEDWDGLAAQVRMSDMLYKDDILKIIEEDIMMDQLEYKLKRLAGGRPYKYMLNEMFPQLRRVEYQIDFSVRDYSSDEIRTKSEKDYPLLSQRELYLLAISGEKEIDSDRIILNVIPSMYQNNVTATVNASSVLISRGEYISAKMMLEPFEHHHEVWNNLGVVYMMEGDLDKAERLIQKAFEMGIPEAEHNLEELKKKRVNNARMERYKARKN